jgi:ABC-type transporter Mla subunit MlaD
LQNVLTRDEDTRGQMNQVMLNLNDRLGMLVDTMRANQQLMLRIAETQTTLAPALHRLSETQGGDEAARGYLRAIEQSLQRLLAEMEQGRSRSTADLRNDLRLLTRTVAALADGQR